MTPEQFVARLQSALPASLKSVVLFGSAAAGDFVEGRSNYNVLVVADRLGAAELDALAPAIAAWTAAGNEPPTLFTTEQLARSADAFPIELADIQQSHQILFGPDLLTGMPIAPEQLRLQLERELKGKLLSLRRRYLQAQGDQDRVAALLRQSLSTFLVLFRAALRLYQPHVPAAKLEALTELRRHIDFDPQPFQTVHEFKASGQAPRERSVPELFADYLQEIERIVDAIDRRLHEPAAPAR